MFAGQQACDAFRDELEGALGLDRKESGTRMAEVEDANDVVFDFQGETQQRAHLDGAFGHLQE